MLWDQSDPVWRLKEPWDLHTNSCWSLAEGCFEGGVGRCPWPVRPATQGSSRWRMFSSKKMQVGGDPVKLAEWYGRDRGVGEGPLTACYTTVGAPFSISNRKTILWTSSTVTSSVNSFSDSQVLLHHLLSLQEWSHRVPISLLNSHILSLPCGPYPSTWSSLLDKPVVLLSKSTLRQTIS